MRSLAHAVREPARGRRREHGVVAMDRVDRASQEDGATAVDLGAWIAEHRRGARRGPRRPAARRRAAGPGRSPAAGRAATTTSTPSPSSSTSSTATCRCSSASRDSVREVAIRTGELWLAPAGVPHSPQRPIGTTGLVSSDRASRARPSRFAGTASVRAVVHDIVMERVDPLELRRAMTAFYADEAARTCPSCGTVRTPRRLTATEPMPPKTDLRRRERMPRRPRRLPPGSPAPPLSPRSPTR